MRWPSRSPAACGPTCRTLRVTSIGSCKASRSIRGRSETVMFLGVDGGGTKASYAVIDTEARVRARHVGPSVSHLAHGFTRPTSMLAGGIGELLQQRSE